MEGYFMPRQARNKEKNQPHHIISRGIDEVKLCATDEDKEFYVNLINASSNVYRIEILSYCIMDTHVHILIHPRKGDISKFMHAINNSYAKYYNRVHKRRGHLFAERFKNIVVKGFTQLLRNSTYIHNNPKDLLYKGYKSVEDYPYSSIKDYTEPGNGKGIAKPNYIFNLMGGTWIQAENHYKKLLEIQSQGREEFQERLSDEFKKTHYITDKKMVLRDIASEDVVRVVTEIMHVNNVGILHVKNYKKYSRYKAMMAICLKVYSDLTLSEMTHIFRNHTSANIGRYARQGFIEFEKNPGLFSRIELALSS